MVNVSNKTVRRKTVRQEKNTVPVANRNYKDTIFRLLFSDKRNLLSLYNALNGKTYDNPEDLEIVTLENAVYMEMKNDLAFILNLNLFLFEHQSTYNPNIPLRDLLYIASEYQKLVDSKSLYSSKLLKIPAPRFVVILAEFLSKNRAEAIRMSIFEYNKEVEERKLREAEFEYGRSEGLKEGEKAQAITVARRMLEADESIDKIQKYTGCTAEEIQKLNIKK